MPRPQAPPQVKGPNSERGGRRFRIRIYDRGGHKDLSFATYEAAIQAKALAEQVLSSRRQIVELGGEHGTR